MGIKAIMIGVLLLLGSDGNEFVNDGAIVYSVGDGVIEVRRQGEANVYVEGSLRYDVATGEARVEGRERDIIHRDSFRDYGEFQE